MVGTAADTLGAACPSNETRSACSLEITLKMGVAELERERERTSLAVRRDIYGRTGNDDIVAVSGDLIDVLSVGRSSIVLGKTFGDCCDLWPTDVVGCSTLTYSRPWKISGMLCCLIALDLKAV